MWLFSKICTVEYYCTVKLKKNFKWNDNIQPKPSIGLVTNRLNYHITHHSLYYLVSFQINLSWRVHPTLKREKDMFQIIYMVILSWSGCLVKSLVSSAPEPDIWTISCYGQIASTSCVQSQCYIQCADGAKVKRLITIWFYVCQILLKKIRNKIEDIPCCVIIITCKKSFFSMRPGVAVHRRV